MTVVAIFAAASAAATPIQLFNFTAVVTQTRGFSGVTAGHSLTGTFALDLGVVDMLSADPSRATYLDAGLWLSATTDGVPLNATLPGSLIVGDDAFSAPNFYQDSLSLGFGTPGGGVAQLSMFTLANSAPVGPLTSDAIPTVIDVTGFTGFIPPVFIYQANADRTLRANLLSVTAVSEVTPVPEPATMSLVGLGFAATAGYRRLRRKRHAS